MRKIMSRAMSVLTGAPVVRAVLRIVGFRNVADVNPNAQWVEVIAVKVNGVSVHQNESVKVPPGPLHLEATYQAIAPPPPQADRANVQPPYTMASVVNIQPSLGSLAAQYPPAPLNVGDVVTLIHEHNDTPEGDYTVSSQVAQGAGWLQGDQWAFHISPSGTAAPPSGGGGSSPPPANAPPANAPPANAPPANAPPLTPHPGSIIPGPGPRLIPAVVGRLIKWGILPP